MKYLDEYRDGIAAGEYLSALRRLTTRSWTLMEICGGQTHSIVKHGLDELLPPEISLVHGPGCPVCVTPLEMIEKALEIAARPEVTFCSFGDMLRVPGRDRDLASVRASGGDVRVVYSPLDAVHLAERHPDRQVVFFAVGFETTAPANALAVRSARERGISNFSLLVSHVLVPPAMEAILSAESNRVQGFLAAGHVCAIMGVEEYRPLAARFRVPIVVTGFEPLDLLQGVTMCVRQLESGRAEVENQYARVVRGQGNLEAQALIREVFTVIPRKWRGLGEIAASGLGLRPTYASFDAELRFAPNGESLDEPESCRSGQVLRGTMKPVACPAFASECTPEHPLGATMVSNEGACAAYYRYRVRTSASRVLHG
ncbi:MAG: hydrogenase formation protein HypD [Candidatus Eisenbacteria bacterium]|nr:hydrogenase formation protein HypD [Candidatus Eisenbacteria bacterium]